MSMLPSCNVLSLYNATTVGHTLNWITGPKTFKTLVILYRLANYSDLALTHSSVPVAQRTNFQQSLRNHFSSSAEAVELKTIMGKKRPAGLKRGLGRCELLCSGKETVMEQHPQIQPCEWDFLHRHSMRGLWTFGGLLHFQRKLRYKRAACRANEHNQLSQNFSLLWAKTKPSWVFCQAASLLLVQE